MVRKSLDIKVVMMGLGYIGLPTAALMASKGIHVHGVDINQKTVDTINRGQIHIVEPDLDGLVRHVVSEGYLKADTSPCDADVFLIAVPTPFKGGFEPDLSYVESAVKGILPFIKEGNLVILESTSPVGTTEYIEQIINKERPEIVGQYFLAYCPERVLPGRVIYELENNDRSIGGINKDSTDKAISFYRNFVKGDLIATNSKTAEMCKLVENSSRDVNIAFANELSMICDEAGVDIHELISLANKHPRVNILSPGPGVGGHCIPVDPWFLVSSFPEKSRLIKSAREVNNYKTEWVIEKIKNQALQFELEYGRKPIIACLGLTYKADIDDTRESPALHIVKTLIKDGLEVMAVDPHVESVTQIALVNLQEAILNCDLAVKLVDHKYFKELTNKEFNSIIEF